MMIDRGVLEWLVTYLRDTQQQQQQQQHQQPFYPSSYGLEYATALFMNLCLHRSGKDRCLPQAAAVLDLFCSLLLGAVGDGGNAQV